MVMSTRINLTLSIMQNEYSKWTVRKTSSDKAVIPWLLFTLMKKSVSECTKCNLTTDILDGIQQSNDKIKLTVPTL